MQGAAIRHVARIPAMLNFRGTFFRVPVGPTRDGNRESKVFGHRPGSTASGNRFGFLRVGRRFVANDFRLSAQPMMCGGNRQVMLLTRQRAA